MAEKVIFEFRAEPGEGGCGFSFRHDTDEWLFPASLWACCQMMGTSERPRAEGKRRSRGPKHKVRRHMRDTLDFYEQLYEDLFGRETSEESDSPQSG